MADNQGTGLPDGNFARQKAGRKVNNLLANVAQDGRGFRQRSEPPANPEVGDVYLTDGTNWDPNAAGAPDLVIYDTAGGWTSIATL